MDEIKERRKNNKEIHSQVYTLIARQSHCINTKYIWGAIMYT